MPLSLFAGQSGQLKARRVRSSQRGLSLVELMVGITVGLIVVAAASVMVSGQLTENRRLIAEAQVQQDLRSSVDIIVRELRRAGGSSAPADLVWDPLVAGDPAENLAANLLSPTTGSGTEVAFAYDVAPASPLGKGFRLNSTTGSVESCRVDPTDGSFSSCQELTDRNTIEVTTFNVTRLPDETAMVPCPTACSSGGATDCWPRVVRRALSLELVAQSRALPEIVRRHEAVIHLRNDRLPFAGGANLCPT